MTTTGDRRDEVEESLSREDSREPYIPVIDETERLTELIDWGIHEVAASYRKHVAPDAISKENPVADWAFMLK